MIVAEMELELAPPPPLPPPEAHDGVKGRLAPLLLFPLLLLP